MNRLNETRQTTVSQLQLRANEEGERLRTGRDDILVRYYIV